MIINEEDYISHYGTKRHSGRYPWGSGGDDNVPHRSMSFLDMVDDLKRQGLTDPEICVGLGIGKTIDGKFYPSTTQLRAKRTIVNAEIKASQISQAQKLKDTGMSNVAIGKEMGIGESQVRALLAPGVKDRNDILFSTSNMLKDQVAAKGIIDIGSGVENHLGVSQQKLNASVAILKEQGYQVHSVNIPQLGTQFDTKVKVLTPPGTTWGEAQKNASQIKQISSFSDDGGLTYAKTHSPLPVDSKRVAVKYKEDGGDQADGVIYVRPGVPDLDMGKSRYAQVRIQVGDTHYLKGMAVYKDDLPPGVDLLFNTAKSSTGNKLDAMKKLETDNKDFPFGSVVRQIVKDPGTPNERVTSAMNIMGLKPGSGEEGGWSSWKKSIASQVLSKQPPALAKTQLDLTYDRRKKEFAEINALTNAAVKKTLLKNFSDETDKAAVMLDAAKLPRQGWHVILPVNTLKEHEIYAPNYRDGERVVLIRYPHGGTFEIPELTVNNKHRDSKSLLGTHPPDVVGIHHTVAQRLSGADFDGDTVLVIPNNSGRIKHTPALDKLKDFDPKSTYKNPPGTEFRGNKQILMGDISNLITDMTIKGAPPNEIARAVRHSMVVIDADKKDNTLNYKQSYIDHGIAKLKQEYQDNARGGASTIISRATSETRVPHRELRKAKDGGPIDKVTGRKVYVETGKTRVNLRGVEEPIKIKSTKLAETDDAYTLISPPSGTRIEKIYADHSNRLKSLANEARLSMINTPRLKYSSSAKKAYSPEVKSLDAKLALAKKNSPLERQAQIIGNASYKAIVDANPTLSKDSRKKLKYQQLEEARRRVGAKKIFIDITPKEWDAIQNGAVSNNKLEEILANSNLETVRKLATPRRQVLMTPTNTNKARRLLAQGYTRAEVADALGVSLSTLDAATTG